MKYGYEEYQARFEPYECQECGANFTEGEGVAIEEYNYFVCNECRGQDEKDTDSSI